MTISAVAFLTVFSWDTVKEIEKRNMKKKFKHISLKGLEIIGIDEVYLGFKMGYLTIV